MFSKTIWHFQLKTSKAKQRQKGDSREPSGKMFLNGRSKITMMERKRKWFTSAEDTRRINLSRFNPENKLSRFFKTSRDDSKVNINEVD